MEKHELTGTLRGTSPRVPAIVPMDIRPLIYEIRGRQVMLDRDLAAIYQVLTKRLNEQVRRNIERFPAEFMFQLTKDEMNELVANCDRFKTMKHSSVAMTAFTEQGVAMLSAVLKSDIAVRESIRIIKAFVAMRKALTTRGLAFENLVARVEANERRQIVDQERNEQRFEEIHAKMSEGDLPLAQIFYRHTGKARRRNDGLPLHRPVFVFSHLCV